MAPWRRCRYSVWEVWKCRPDVQREWRGREIVVFEISGGEMDMGMWYATASGPVRSIACVLEGRGLRALGMGVGGRVKRADCFVRAIDSGNGMLFGGSG